jgi:hypothetical protein
MSVDLELDLGGRLELAFGKQTDRMLDKLVPHKPILNRASGAVTFAGAGEQYLDLGSPNTGRVWELTSLTLYGVDDNTAVANVKVALYFGDSFVPSLSSLVIPGLAVPSYTDVGTETLYCQSQENIVIGISGTGNGQVGANITYRDWPDAAISARNGATLR